MTQVHVGQGCKVEEKVRRALVGFNKCILVVTVEDKLEGPVAGLIITKQHFSFSLSHGHYVFQVRISNCIIMDNVTVATGSVLQVQILSPT